MRIDFINVGDGDAILIRDTAGEPFTMLVDCGRQLVDFIEGSKRQHAVDFLRKEGVETIDLLVLSHMHIDHFGGGLLMLPHIRVQKAMVGYLPPLEQNRSWLIPPIGSVKSVVGLFSDCNRYCDLLEGLSRQGCQLEEIREDRSISLTNNLSMDVMMPEEDLMLAQKKLLDHLLKGGEAPVDLIYRVAKARNNSSLILRLHYGGRRVLLPGDAYASCLESRMEWKADVLKLSHHGDDKALTRPLFERVRPAFGVISCQSNSGEKCRPAREVIQILQEEGVTFFCTENEAQEGLAAASHDSIRLEISQQGGMRLFPSEEASQRL